MHIQQTKSVLKDLVVKSESLKRGFEAMVTTAPQILAGEDLREIREVAVVLASNFATCAQSLNHFARIKGDNYVPSMRLESEEE